MKDQPLQDVENIRIRYNLEHGKPELGTGCVSIAMVILFLIMVAWLFWMAYTN